MTLPRRASRRRRGARLLLRDLRHRLNGALHVQRIALTSEQVEEHDLPPQPGKTTDARSAAFALRHGRLVQVELDALRHPAIYLKDADDGELRAQSIPT